MVAGVVVVVVVGMHVVPSGCSNIACGETCVALERAPDQQGAVLALTLATWNQV